MHTHLGDVVQYQLPIGDDRVDINDLMGKEITLHHDGRINCIACDRPINKSFNQGYCYPCLRSLAQCDSCIIKPELCHYAEGSCREPTWGEQYCLQDHYVYLANSSGIKVGITRGTQIPVRWMDQGAVQALPIFRVKDRLTSGLVEVALKAHVADKTHWQRMLKGVPDPVDLSAKRDELYALCQQELAAIEQRQGASSITYLRQESPVDICFPVAQYPLKVKSLNLDKTPEVKGILQGIKGQYLILDSGVINIRKFAGYNVVFGC
ncbi:MAG: DUF2797 domain-containing protein [Gammaproteobacteria bacterium]|nr:DUF2797 domain-containing protein [Gammaproteobacteria bacterium]